MLYWLLINVGIGLILPVAAVVIVAAVFLRQDSLNLPRLIRDFQLCLSCLALAAGTVYDVVIEANSRDSAKGLDVALGLPMIAIVFCSIFYGVSLTAGQITTTNQQDSAIAVISTCTVVMTLVFLLIARRHFGLL